MNNPIFKQQTIFILILGLLLVPSLISAQKNNSTSALISPVKTLLQSLSIEPKEYTFGQTVIGKGAITNSTSEPIVVSFRIKLFKGNNVMVWSRDVDNLTLQPGFHNFNLDDVFGFKPAIPGDSFYAGKWTLTIENKANNNDKISASFIIRAPKLSLTLSIDPKELELEQSISYVKAGAITNSESTPVPASFKTELFQGSTLKFTREIPNISIPVGISTFSLEDAAGVSSIPFNDSLLGAWKLKITALASGAIAEDAFNIVVQNPGPITINVDYSQNGRDISKLKKGYGMDIQFRHSISRGKYQYGYYDQAIGYDDSLIRLHFGDLRARAHWVEETIKAHQKYGNPDIMITLFGMPFELSSWKEFGNDVGCEPFFQRVPPKDYNKWKEFIKDYVTAAKPYNVKYWEIWNEAGSGCFWMGTEEEFFKLYKATAEGIIEAYGGAVPPDVKIGGPSLSYWSEGITPGSGRPLYMTLPEFAGKNNLPLDFFSWHYTPAFAMKKAVSKIRAELDKNGYKNAELIINEYGTGDPKNKITYSANTAAEFISMANLGIDKQAVWSFSNVNVDDLLVWSWVGLFGVSNEAIAITPKFNLFKVIAKMPDTLIGADSPMSLPGFLPGSDWSDLALAAKSNGKASVLLVNPFGAKRTFNLSLSNIPQSFTSYTKYIIDNTHSNAYRVTGKIKQRIAEIEREIKRLPENEREAYIKQELDKINNWTEVRLYSETKDIIKTQKQKENPWTYTETFELEPYAVVMVELER